MNNFTKGEWISIFPKQRTKNYEGYIECGDSTLAIITGENCGCSFGGVTRDWSSKNAEEEDFLEHQENANLMVAAGNAANTLAEQGIDAIKAIEALPDIMETCKNLIKDAEEENGMQVTSILYQWMDDFRCRLKGE